MRSIIYTRTGDPSVLEVVERPVPEPGAGEVRVRVIVSAVNPSDWKSRQGRTPGAEMPFAEVTPNQDGAGVVDAVGAGVTTVAPGDRVWIYKAAFQRPTGTAQDFTVLPAEQVVPLPDGVSFDVGASMGIPAMTAHRALTTHEDGPSRLAPGALEGKVVLVQGGAGAVGHAAIQLAHWAGATVITTISSDAKAALASAAGAQHAVNYREEDVAERIREIAPDGVDIVVEVSIAKNGGWLHQVVADRAVVSIYASDGGDDATLPIMPSAAVNTRYQFLLVYTMGQPALNAAAEDITAALSDGALPVGEEAGLALIRFPLEKTADAHAAVQEDAVGKVLIDIAAE